MKKKSMGERAIPTQNPSQTGDPQARKIKVLWKKEKVEARAGNSPSTTLKKPIPNN